MTPSLFRLAPGAATTLGRCSVGDVVEVTNFDVRPKAGQPYAIQVGTVVGADPTSANRVEVAVAGVVHRWNVATPCTLVEAAA